MTEFSLPIAVLLCAWLLDTRVGEPPAFVHPVVWMGRAIVPLQRLRFSAPARAFATGALYATLVTALFVALAAASLWLAARVRAPWLAFAVAVFWLWCCFAIRGLVSAGAQVRAQVERGDLQAARRALSSLCSRDAGELSEAEVLGASIESLTENCSDSIVAPLFYFLLFGVPGAVGYRAINTLDAMVGYRGKYEWSGKFAARLDDVLNWVPARLTVAVLGLAGFTLGLDVRGGLTVWWRDARRTESPNAGHPMAMAAGLLGVRLDKRGAYVLGADRPAPDVRALRAAEELVRVAGLVTLLGTALGLAALEGGHVFLR